MEHKSIRGVRVTKGAAAGTAEVVIATMGPVDHDGDVVSPGAIGSQVVPILPAHDWNHIPLGKARTREVGDQVVADLTFNMEVPQARDWHAALMFDMEHGPSVQEYSWGYDPLKSKPGMVGNRRVRILESVRLHEVSMVVRGASVGSHTVGVKSQPVDPALERELGRAKSNIDAYNRRLIAEMEEIRSGLDLAIAVRESRDLLGHFYTACDHPDPVIDRAGRACFEMCCEELGLERRPKLLWMTPETVDERNYVRRYGFRDWTHLFSDVPVYGAYQPAFDAVWVRTDLSFEKTIEYVAHEARHAAGGDENDAYAYQALWAGRVPEVNERSTVR